MPNAHLNRPRINQLLAQKAWTLDDLADHADVDKRTLSMPEGHLYSARIIRRIAEALEVDPAEIVVTAPPRFEAGASPEVTNNITQTGHDQAVMFGTVGIVNMVHQQQIKSEKK
jgi:DNA-binding Xre family transcriptional regulator